MGGDRGLLPAVARRAWARRPITLSLTPVLCDQLEPPGAIGRCLAFLSEIRPESHRRDAVDYARDGDDELVAELERSAAEYAAAAERLAGLPRGLLAALGAHVSWTSSATHAVLPLVATDAGIELQLQTGLASHRRRFGDWHGGFWLPECAHAPWLDEPLEEAGVRATVRRADRRRSGSATSGTCGRSPPTPVRSCGRSIARSWRWRGARAGTRRARAYRDYHHRTAHDHRVWRNDGGPYDPAAAPRAGRRPTRRTSSAASGSAWRAAACAVRGRHRTARPLVVRGRAWLAAVLDEAARQGLTLTTLDDALERHEPAPAPPDGAGRQQLGGGGGPAHLERPARSPIWPGSCAPPSSTRSRSARGPATARCGSCWRCRPATGRSWHTGGGRGVPARAGRGPCRGAATRAGRRRTRRAAQPRPRPGGLAAANRAAADLERPASVGYSQRNVCRRVRIRISGRDPADDSIGGDIGGDHRAGADHRVVADGDAAQHAGAVSDPDVVADVDVALVDPLLADRPLDLDHPVVEVDHHHPVGDDALAPDRDVLDRPRSCTPGRAPTWRRSRPALVGADLAAVAEPGPAAELTVALRPISNLTPGQTKHSPSVRSRPRQRSFSHIQRAISGSVAGAASCGASRAKRRNVSGPPCSGRRRLADRVRARRGLGVGDATPGS